jgi:ubiquinone/menaquinone biosynthesis C-methylase UbiE
MGRNAEVGNSAAPVGKVVKGVVARALDRMVAVGYGVVYDYIFEQFGPYQSLQREVMELVESAVPESTNRRDVRILELGCGPGNLALKLAEAGFTVFGLDRYGSLIDLAREKRQAKRLANLSFQHGDLAKGSTFRDGTFDQIVNVHSLYVHPEPDRKLKEAFRVLKPAGHAVFVNHTRRVELWATFRELRARQGLGPAIRSLLWLVPNAVFEVARRKVGPTYWEEDEFTAHLQAAGFTVLKTRMTFLNDASLLIWARKDSPE